MIDINTILTQALTAAVAEAMLPLQQEYANKMGEMATRIAALEAKLAEAALFERTTEVTVPVDEAKMAEALNSQEWFWEKVRRFADAAAHDSITHHEDTVYHYDKGAVETLIEDALDAHLENANHPDDDDIDTKIDSAIEQHEENRTHGDKDDIEEMVQKLLNGASISISV